MADVDHPKTHVEDQDLSSPRKQPESPQHEGIDPLTESDTMYPRNDTKTDIEKASEKAANADSSKAPEDTTVADQDEPDVKAPQQPNPTLAKK